MQGKFAKIPVILGTNTDEGFGVNGVNTDEQAVQQLLSSKRWSVDEEEARRLLELYPNDPREGEPYGWGNKTWPENGLQWKRYQSIATDLTMYAPRRLLAEKMSEEVEHVYSYRWDAPKFNNTPNTIGVNHFSEVRSQKAVGHVEELTSCRFRLCLETLRKISRHWATAPQTFSSRVRS
jgi:acetylcholinesterase